MPHGDRLEAHRFDQTAHATPALPLDGTPRGDGLRRLPCRRPDWPHSADPGGRAGQGAAALPDSRNRLCPVPPGSASAAATRRPRRCPGPGLPRLSRYQGVPAGGGGSRGSCGSGFPLRGRPPGHALLRLPRSAQGGPTPAVRRWWRSRRCRPFRWRPGATASIATRRPTVSSLPAGRMAGAARAVMAPITSSRPAGSITTAMPPLHSAARTRRCPATGVIPPTPVPAIPDA